MIKLVLSVPDVTVMLLALALIILGIALIIALLRNKGIGAAYFERKDTVTRVMGMQINQDQSKPDDQGTYFPGGRGSPSAPDPMGEDTNARIRKRTPG